MNVVELSIAGNSEQETREGYNKIEVNTNNYTLNGITVTNNNDGSLTLNGTNADKVTYIQINATGSALKNNYFDLVNGDNYYLYAGAVMNGNMGLYIRSDSDVAYSLFVSGSGIGKVITWGGQTCENGFAFLRIGENVTLNNLTIRPMLAKSDVELEYEPYGAMPSPSYPSKVETVGSKENLFDITKIEQNKFIDGNLSAYGKLGDSGFTNTSDYISVEAGETYVLNYEYEELSNTSKRRLLFL